MVYRVVIDCRAEYVEEQVVLKYDWRMDTVIGTWEVK